MADVRLATYLDLQQEIEARQETDANVESIDDDLTALAERVRMLEGASGWDS